MDKEYFVSINNVSKELGIPAYTLRYWEKQFPTIVHPTTGAGGRRYYRAEAIERLRKIQDLLYNRGMTIAGVKKLIHNGEFTVDGAATVSHVVAKKPTVVKQKVESFDDMDIVSDTIPVPKVNPINSAKLDLTIGLLSQAKDLLE
ncbi:MAG: MerR family transcriptional regulator [Alphaproteobacteria bacterium]|nr:MerR family transcriptional regulator [Alphaproteobacteria bacterium]